MDEAEPRSGQGSPRDELNALLSAAIDMGFKLIAKHGSHVPFAMAIGSDGRRINLVVDDSQVHDVDVLTGSLLNQLRSMCDRNELRAIAFARNVEYRSATDGSHVDAIEVNLDHVHDTAVRCMIPYRLSDSGQPAPGELVRIDPREVFFRRSDGK